MRLSNEQSDVYTLIGSYVVLEPVCRTLMNILSASNFFKEHEEQLASNGIRIVQRALMMIEQGNADEKEQGALIVKCLVDAYSKIIEKLIDNKASQALVVLFSQEKGMIELLTTVLLLPMAKEPAIIFEPNPTTNLQVFFNEAKGNIMEIFKSYINHLFIKYPPQAKLKTLYFHKRLETILSEVNQSIFKFRQVCTKPAEELESSVESFVTPAMNFIAKSIEIQDYYSIYATIFRRMVVEVFLPELAITQRERDTFIENEVEFVNLAFDTCFNQKSKVPKVLAMKSIENFCDKIDGATSFVAIGVLALADAVLGGKSESDVLSEVTTVEPFLKSQFVKRFSAEEVLDVCLLVITSITYHIIKRTDLL